MLRYLKLYYGHTCSYLLLLPEQRFNATNLAVSLRTALEDSHYFCEVLSELFPMHSQLTDSEKGLHGAPHKAWLHYMSLCQTLNCLG